MASAEPVHVESARPFAGTVANAWRALTDISALGGLLPEGTLGAPGGDGGISVTFTLSFDAAPVTYVGSARVAERNGRAHRVAVELAGQDADGVGSLTASTAVAVRRSADAVVVRVEVDAVFNGGAAADADGAAQQAAVAHAVERFLDRLTDSRGGGDVVSDEPTGSTEPTDSPTDGDAVAGNASGASTDADAAAAGDTATAGTTPAPRKRPRPSRKAAEDDAPAADDASAAQSGPGTAAEPATTQSDADQDAAASATGEAGPETLGESFGMPPTDESESTSGSSIESSTPSSSTDEAAPSFATPGGIPVPTLADEPSVNGHSPTTTPRNETALAVSTRQAMAKRIAPVAVGLVFVLAAARRRRGKRA